MLMIQPPKISPAAFVSAGMALMRNASSPRGASTSAATPLDL
jgi:hypothetical protein